MFRNSWLMILALAGCMPVHAKPPLGSDSVNLSSSAFVAGLASQDRQEQERARMYLLGVLDATEGRVWCDYTVAKTVSLQEFVFEALKKSPADSRAAAQIEAELARRLPCKDRP